MPEPFRARVTALVAHAIADLGGAVGGGNALWLHRIVDRFTQDVDGFLNSQDPNQFNLAEEAITRTLGEVGLVVQGVATDSWFRAFRVADGQGNEVLVDINYAFRQRDPVAIDQVHAVLHLDDLIDGKLLAFTSRVEARDYVDVDAFIVTGNLTLGDMVSRLKSLRPEWTTAMLADQFRAIHSVARRHFYTLALIHR